MIKLNSSNPNKIKELLQLGLCVDEITNINIHEPLADSDTIIAYKATICGPNCIVEDVQLDIEGANIGVLVKYFVNDIQNYINKRAKYSLKIGILYNDIVEVYTGEVYGIITNDVINDGVGFGFDYCFLPDGENTTLHINKPNHVNPRAIALAKFFNKIPDYKLNPIYKWHGKFQ